MNKAFLDQGEVVETLEFLVIVADLVPWDPRVSLESLVQREVMDHVDLGERWEMMVEMA